VTVGGFDVRVVDGGEWSASRVARYVTKPGWGVATELVSAEKVAAGNRYSPFEMLSEFRSTGDVKLADRFREYAAASRGVALLRWSRGLRQALGLLETVVSDEEAANVADAETVTVYTFSRQEWADVVGARARLTLLDAADHYGLPGVAVVLRRCREKRRVWVLTSPGPSPPGGRLLA